MTTMPKVTAVAIAPPEHGMRFRRSRMTTRGLRQRAWWVIRRRGVFTLPELLSVLADGTERDAAGNLRKYLQALARCGILTIEKELVFGGTPTNPGVLRYRLVINNGGAAPVWRTTHHEVFDPNNRIIYMVRKGDDDA